MHDDTGSTCSRWANSQGRTARLAFEVVQRYEALAQFHRQAGFDDEAGWLTGRLERIRGVSK